MLDANRIYCGDCLELMKELPDKCVDAVVTDIPYNEVNRKSNGLRNLDKGEADGARFDLSSTLAEIFRITSGSIYLFCGTEHVSYIRRRMKRHGISTRHCVWRKTNPSPMNGEHLWLSDIENCMYGKYTSATFNQFCKSSVWTYPVVHGQIHPTHKPIPLFQYIIESSTNPNDIILDPFLGSGTTAVAALRTGRRFIGMEISPEYCAIAQKRIDAELAQLKLDL